MIVKQKIKKKQKKAKKSKKSTMTGVAPAGKTNSRSKGFVGLYRDFGIKCRLE